MARKIQDNPRPRKESAGQWRRVPRPVDWLARVEYVKARDVTCRRVENGKICQSTQGLEVHHAGAPDDHDVASLILLCHRHHAWETGQQIAESRERNRISRKRPAERHPGLIE